MTRAGARAVPVPGARLRAASARRRSRLKEKRSALRAPARGRCAPSLGDLAGLDAEAARRPRDRVAAAGGGGRRPRAVHGGRGGSWREARPRWRAAAAAPGRPALVARGRPAGRGSPGDRRGGERIERLERELRRGARAGERLDRAVPPARAARGTPGRARPLDATGRGARRRKGAMAQLEEVRRQLGLGRRAHSAASPPPGCRGRARARSRSSARLADAVALDAENAGPPGCATQQDARTKRQGLADQYQDLRDQRQRAGKGRDPRATARPAPGRSARSYEKVLGVLDRQIEEVVFNGNFYKQRIEQLAGRARGGRSSSSGSGARAGGRSCPAATAELGRLEAQAQEGARLDDRARRARRPGHGAGGGTRRGGRAPTTRRRHCDGASARSGDWSRWRSRPSGSSR